MDFTQKQIKILERSKEIEIIDYRQEYPLNLLRVLYSDFAETVFPDPQDREKNLMQVWEKFKYGLSKFGKSIDCFFKD